MTTLLRSHGYDVGFQYADGTEERIDDAIDWHAAERAIWVLDDELGRVRLEGRDIDAVVYVRRAA